MKKGLKAAVLLLLGCLTVASAAACKNESKELELIISNEKIEIPAEGENISEHGWKLENDEGQMKLTLDNAIIKNDMANKDTPAIRINGDLDIILAKGSENTISGETNAIEVMGGDVVIRGQGQLTLMAKETAIHYSDIAEEHTLTFDGGTVEIFSDMIGMQISQLNVEDTVLTVSSGFYGIFGGYEGSDFAVANFNDGDVSIEAGYIAVCCDRTNVKGGNLTLSGLDEDSIGLMGERLSVDLQHGSATITAGMAAVLAEAVTEAPTVSLGVHTGVTTEGAVLADAVYQKEVETNNGIKLEACAVKTYVVEGPLSYDSEQYLWINAAKEVAFGRQ